MKKMVNLLLILMCLISLNSCKSNEYEEYAGVYDLYYVSDSKSNIYDYYRIILEANGDCKIIYKLKTTSQILETKSKFELKYNRIKIYNKSFGSETAHEYDYINNEIHMNTYVDDFTFTMKFRRS